MKTNNIGHINLYILLEYLKHSVKMPEIQELPLAYRINRGQGRVISQYV